MYAQCLLLRTDLSDEKQTVQDTIWIPDMFAKKGGELIIRKRGESAGYPVRVIEVYQTTERDMAGSEMVWSKHRGVTDI